MIGRCSSGGFELATAVERPSSRHPSDQAQAEVTAFRRERLSG